MTFTDRGAVKTSISGPLGQGAMDESLPVVLASNQSKTPREKSDFNELLQQLIQVNEKLSILIEKRK